MLRSDARPYRSTGPESQHAIILAHRSDDLTNHEVMISSAKHCHLAQCGELEGGGDGACGPAAYLQAEVMVLFSSHDLFVCLVNCKNINP